MVRPLLRPFTNGVSETRKRLTRRVRHTYLRSNGLCGDSGRRSQTECSVLTGWKNVVVIVKGALLSGEEGRVRRKKVPSTEMGNLVSNLVNWDRFDQSRRPEGGDFGVLTVLLLCTGYTPTGPGCIRIATLKQTDTLFTQEGRDDSHFYFF